MWTNDQRFGLSTQDLLDVESIIAAPDGDTNEVASPSALAVERRSAVRRNSAAFEHYRHWSRAFEFACLTVFAVTGCMVALGAVAQLFVVPLAALEQGFKRS